jgi:hypothetical protein
MIGALSFLTELMKFLGPLLNEFFARSSAKAQAQQAYQVSTAEFNSMVSTVLTRNRLQASQDSQAAQTVETQVDQSENQRKDQP